MARPIHDSVALGLAIRERRRALGLSQQALADRVGVSRQWVVAMEAGKERAEIGLVLRLIRGLDLRLSVEALAEPPLDLDALLGDA